MAWPHPLFFPHLHYRLLMLKALFTLAPPSVSTSSLSAVGLQNVPDHPSRATVPVILLANGTLHLAHLMVNMHYHAVDGQHSNCRQHFIANEGPQFEM